MKKLITTCCLAVSLVLPLAMTSTAQAEPHPEIHAAIDALKAARDHLFAAKNDFGGHKRDAVAACDEAIKQLKLAIDYDNAKH